MAQENHIKIDSVQELMKASKKFNKSPKKLSNSAKKMLQSPKESENETNPETNDQMDLYEVTNELPCIKHIECSEDEWVFQRREKAKVKWLGIINFRLCF